jgi:peptidoglycan/LPS O-acetylase OafA/YrhL
MKYFNKIKNKKELIYFIIKRFLRLYPLHFLTLIIWSLILLSKFLLNYLSSNVIDPQFFYRNNFESFFLNLFFLHSLVLPYPTFNFIS